MQRDYTIPKLVFVRRLQQTVSKSDTSICMCVVFACVILATCLAPPYCLPLCYKLFTAWLCALPSAFAWLAPDHLYPLALCLAISLCLAFCLTLFMLLADLPVLLCCITVVATCHWGQNGLYCKTLPNSHFPEAAIPCCYVVVEGV